ncbi:MAG TPA: tetratricopeptide repeat protein [Gemmatimonadales bacterium]|nr:tetratricopeptide repeat protein [Gemmatimonadales bacterium]
MIGSRFRHICLPAFALGFVAASCTTPAPVHSTNGLTALRTFADSVTTPPRPSLREGLDTNDALVYYQAAVPLVRTGLDLQAAEAGLYWASRLDPSWADPVYARSLLLLRAVRNDADATFFRTHSVRAVRSVTPTQRQVQLMDSLRRMAWARNPFVFTGLDFADLFLGRHASPEEKGLVAFKSQRFAAADSLFAIALRKHPGEVGLRVYRAQSLFYLARYDSAVTELETGRDSLRATLQQHTAVVLPSIEMFEYAIGIARVQQGDFAAARAAYERALTENLAFYWVHARLAGAALALGDTAAALTELQTAVEINGRDPVIRLFYGVVLHAARRLEEAEQQLRLAVELDSDYAAPYHRLGAVYQGEGKFPQAIEQYRTFLARAPKRDPDRATVTHALVTLGVAPPDSR